MNIFGQDLLAWLVLAIGSALAMGNLLALVRPKEQPRNRQRLQKQNENPTQKDSSKNKETKAPIIRSIFMIILGTAVSIWALASLLT